MSDQSSNMEIQDVLTSIRRLVSEEKNPRGAGAAKDETPAADEPQDKLVLTPAHRVRDGDAGEGEQDREPQADGTSLEDTIAELEAAVAVNGGEFEPDGSEVAKADPADADPDLERAFEDSFGVDLAADDDQQSELSRPVTSGQVDDGGDDDDAPDAHAEAESAGTDDAEDPSEPAPEAENAAVEMPSPEQVDALIAAGTAAAANAAAARRLNLGAGDQIRDGRAPWGRADAPERDDAADREDAPSRATVPTMPSTLDLQAEADAEILREIVADIVRQELQGPLGERITRSVRMLVRREINRALASRDFE